ncbi:hypothetical protein KQH90_03595 [Anaerosalibacter bizertensis]|uniref:hypothetical protein n=1 Tax=Anaerosalibacter bizertensis TaxID=932217 RepID=UPI001C0F0F34|nr:hypothetical protein [Anaerosalibacter bizertensis]MBU5293120.1 hypothetical protein [Anaerosalibacter bizertensis]
MKVKVLKTFIDKHTKERHEKGKEMIINKERYEEILSSPHEGLIEEIKEEKKDNKDKKTKK